MYILAVAGFRKSPRRQMWTLGRRRWGKFRATQNKLVLLSLYPCSELGRDVLQLYGAESHKIELKLRHTKFSV